MKNFYEKMGIIIGFLILIFCIQTFINEKTSENAVLLILFSMVIINADKFTKFLKGKFSGKTSKEKESTKIETEEEYIADDFISGGILKG